MGNQPSHGVAEHQPGQLDWRRSVPLAAAENIFVSGEHKSDLQRTSSSSTTDRHTSTFHYTASSDITLCNNLPQPVPKPRNRAKRKSVDSRRSHGPSPSAADNLSTDNRLQSDAADNADRVAQSARPAKALALEQLVLPEERSPYSPLLDSDRPLSVTGSESELALLQKQQQQQQQQQCCPADSGIASRSVSHCDQQQSTRAASFYEFLGIAPDYLDKALSLDVRFDLEVAETVSSHQARDICQEHSKGLDSPQIPTAATRSAVTRQIVICQDIWDISGESLSDYEDNEEIINKTMEESSLSSNVESPRLDNEKGTAGSLEVRTESEDYKTGAISSAERSDNDTTAAVVNGFEVIDHSSRKMEFNAYSWSHQLDLTTNTGDHLTETTAEGTASNVTVLETEQKGSEEASSHLPSSTEYLPGDRDNIVIEDINSNKVLSALCCDNAVAVAAAVTAAEAEAAAAAAAGEHNSGVAGDLQESGYKSESAVLNLVAVHMQAENDQTDHLPQMGEAANEPREENGDDSHTSCSSSTVPSADNYDAAADADAAAAAANAAVADAAVLIDVAAGTGTTQIADCQFASVTIVKSSDKTSVSPHDCDSNQEIRSYDNATVSPSTVDSGQKQWQFAQGCRESTQAPTCISGPETTDETADQQSSRKPAEQITSIADDADDIVTTAGDCYCETAVTPSSGGLLDTVNGTCTNDGTGNVSNNSQRISGITVNAIGKQNLPAAVNDAEAVSVKASGSQTTSEEYNGVHAAKYTELLSETDGSCCEKTSHDKETFTAGSSSKSFTDDDEHSSSVPPALTSVGNINGSGTVNDFMPETPPKTSVHATLVATNAISPGSTSAADSPASSTVQVLRIRRARVVQAGGAVFGSGAIGYEPARSLVRELPILPMGFAGDSVRQNRPQSDGGDRLFASAPASALRQMVATECRGDTGTIENSAIAERAVASIKHLKTAAETAQNHAKEEIEVSEKSIRENKLEDNFRVGRTVESAGAPNLHSASPSLVEDAIKLARDDSTLAARSPSHSTSPTPTATSQLQSSKVRLGAQPFLRSNSLPAFKPLSKLFTPASPVSPGLANVSEKIDEQAEIGGTWSAAIQCRAQEHNLSCLVEAVKTDFAATEKVDCISDTTRDEEPVLQVASNTLCAEVITCNETRKGTSEGDAIEEDSHKDDAASDKLVLAVHSDVAVSVECMAPDDISHEVSAEPSGRTTGADTISGINPSCTTHNELLPTDSSMLLTTASLINRDTVTEAISDAVPTASSIITTDGSSPNTSSESEEVKTGAGRQEIVSVVNINGSGIDSMERDTVGTNGALEYRAETLSEVSGLSLCKQSESTQGTPVIIADKNIDGSVTSSIDYAAIRRGVHARPVRKASWLVEKSYADGDDDDSISTTSASHTKAGGPDELKLEGVEKERLDIINAMKVRRKTVDLKQEAAVVAPAAPANAPAVGRHTIPNRIRRLSLDGSKHTVQIRSQPTTIVLRRPVSDLVKTLQQSSTNNEQ